MEPITRSEQYLASILGEDVVLPIPQSRIEYYLNAIAQNGIAPSSAGLINYDPDANYPDGSIGKEMHTLDGDVDQLKSQINEVEAGFPQKSASGSIITIDDGADNVPVVGLTAQINPVQSGTGDPAPDNVRPISGWTGANISDTGVNVWDEVWEHGKFNLSTGAEVADDTRVRSKNYLPVKAGETYHIVTPNTLFLMLYDGAKNYMYEADSTANYTIPAGVAYLRFSCPSAYGATYNHDISINRPSSDTSYHAYNGRTVNISWETEAGTVYGGSITLNQDGTADITARLAGVDMGSLTWNRSTSWMGGPVLYSNSLVSEVVKPAPSVIADALCSMYQVVARSTLENNLTIKALAVNNDGLIVVRDSSYEDAALFKTAVTGQTLVYELATPVTYHIENVELVKTLYGLNNIWADTGDVSLTYRADPSMYTAEQIQTMLNAMVATVEPTTTASKAYVVNEFLIMDGTLYKVIANIASGGTITINTNVSATTIGAEITNILNN